MLRGHSRLAPHRRVWKRVDAESNRARIDVARCQDSDRFPHVLEFCWALMSGVNTEVDSMGHSTEGTTA